MKQKAEKHPIIKELESLNSQYKNATMANEAHNTSIRKKIMEKLFRSSILNKGDKKNGR